MRPVLAASRMSVFVCLILLVSPFARLAAQPEKTNTPQDTPAHRTRNSPAIDLPDLEVERRRAPTHPQAPAPIPSTRRPADIAASDAASTPLQDEIELAALDADDHLRAETPFRFSSRDARRDLSDAAPAALLSARALKRLEDGSRHLNSHLAAGSLADAYEPDIYSASDNHSPERAELKNRTGAPGVDLLSGNYNWSVPILSLPGRSGLNLGLSLSYNSRVWTKSASGTSIGFDSDRGYPTPGFRLGFPSIQTLYYNPTTGQNSLLLITPSGARVELRQVGASNVYEAADSSYLQLTVPGDGMSVVVRTTDGTQLTYWYINGEYRCTEVKDRNGNFITANYNSYGRLSSISDTLGRTVSFVYDANLNLQSIQQQWKRETLTGTVAETHVWATFGYSNLSIQTNFSGLATSIANGKIIPVLTQVGFSDGTRYNFEYTSYGQVSVIRNYSADNYQLSYTTYNLPGSTGAAQTDCPRFTERRFWAVNANNNQEALTTYSFDPAGAWGQVTTPDGTTHKELFAPSGWGKGLTIGTETWAGGVKRKWTTNSWTQDNTALAYMLNPRVFETNIYDESGNRRRTEFTYHGPDKFSLPHETREYAADAATLLRTTYREYNLDAAYTTRRIIGLPGETRVYDHQNARWLSKVWFYYDWDNSTNTYLVEQGVASQHDRTNYGPAFIYGRGNLAAVRRWNADAPDDWNSAVWASFTGYNTQGSLIMSADANGYETRYTYSDSFSDAITRNTYAYPTQVTNPAGHSSYVQYNYDMGLTTRTQDPKGAVFTNLYDAARRPERVTNQVNNAYTRWVYAPRGYFATFTTVEAGAPEAYSATSFDGAWRVHAVASDHPGSVGGYKAQQILRDAMGRTMMSSHPTEINGSWLPSGDDAAGWVWSYQSYDWKGRPTVTTNADGTTSSVTYGGCGCAGGETVTTTDEAGRKQRMTADVLGRAWKMETLNTDGSVYRTTTKTYDALDRVTNITDRQGTSGAAQVTSMAYDGHGRLWKQRAPHQTADAIYTYNADDTLANVTDARGAVTTYSYNSRHLPTGVSYSAPTNVAVSSNAFFDYDAAGNRVTMVDGFGTVNYQYDTLSRLTSETRTFSDPANSSINGQAKTLSYTYNLAGGLKSITDPTGSEVTYGYDHTGRLTGVGGTPYGGISQYASTMQYRAWDALKSLSYGNARTLNLQYNTRLQVSRYEIPGLVASEYRYTTSVGGSDNDGRVKFVRDLSQADSPFDRAYRYDHTGMLVEGLSGSEARGGVVADGPYRETFTHDAWGNVYERTRRHWQNDYNESFVYNQTTGRNQSWTYDAAGNVTVMGVRQYQWDAAGLMSKMTDQVQTLHGTTQRTLRRWYDGDGQHLKETKNATTIYRLRSSVLGGRVITELDAVGAKKLTNVYAGGELMAKQEAGAVRWQHRAPHDVSVWETSATGAYAGRTELDAVGADVGLAPPPAQPIPEPVFSTYGNASDLGNDVYVDGVPAPQFLSLMLIGMSHYNLQLTGGVAQQEYNFVDAWDDYFIAPDPNNPSDGGTTGSRNVGMFVKATGNNSLQTSVVMKNPLTATQVDELEKALRKLLSENETCRNFIEQMLTEAGNTARNPPITTSMMELFSIVSNQLGFAFGTEYRAGAAGTAESGYSGVYQTGGYSQVLLSSGIATNYPNAQKVKDEHLYVTLGELTHIAGRKTYGPNYPYHGSAGYGDNQLLRAGAKVAPGLQIKAPTNIPDPNTDVYNYSSRLYHQLLERACGRKI